MPASMVFAAAFGEQSPVASNDDEQGRSQNRRVEMAPVPRNNGTENKDDKSTSLLDKNIQSGVVQ